MRCAATSTELSSTNSAGLVPMPQGMTRNARATAVRELRSKVVPPRLASDAALAIREAYLRLHTGSTRMSGESGFGSSGGEGGWAR